MKTLTTSEAATILNVTPSRVRQLVCDGKLRPVSVGNGHASHRFHKSEIDRSKKNTRKYVRKLK